jgi:hypothetical protein
MEEPSEARYPVYYAEKIRQLPPAQSENQAHLCDSCRNVYPECPSGKDDVIFGNGKGNDNICACNQYEPSVQPRKKGKWIYKPNIYGVAYCSECDFELHINDTPYCPNCGAEMKGEEDAKSM